MRDIRSRGIMKEDVMNNIIDKLFENVVSGDTISIAFQGGEPTLAGLGYFKKFVKRVSLQQKETAVEYSLQTNGLLLDEKWAGFLKENNFLVGLSLDGPEMLHNSNRLLPNHRGSFKNVYAAKTLLENYNISYSILSVLTKDAARHPDEIFDFLLRDNISKVQFIPCLGKLESSLSEGYSLDPKAFRFFYSRIFKRWRDELLKGHYISIQFIDGILQQILRRGSRICGLDGCCRMQNVIEADGTVYPCDFYPLDLYEAGRADKRSIVELEKNAENNIFFKDKPSLPSYCRSCSFLPMCGGG